MKVTEHTKMCDFYRYEPLQQAARYLVGCADHKLHEMIAEDDFVKMHEDAPTWGIRDMVYGMQRLADLAESGIPYFHSVYSAEETEQDRQKEDVKLFYFPAKQEIKRTDQYVLLCSGGAYRNVCNPQEAFPVAARLNELGITAFALDYRTWSPALKESGVAAAAVEDVAAALRYIDRHAKLFQVKPGAYGIGGFSAGGHLAALWGTKENGYGKFRCAKPEILFLDYAVVCFQDPDQVPEEALEVYRIVAGEELSREQMERAAVTGQVDEDYPPVVLAQCEDDDQVPFENWRKMKQSLETAGVPHLAMSGRTGGHGYGLGTGTELEGWIDRGVRFWMDL